MPAKPIDKQLRAEVSAAVFAAAAKGAVSRKDIVKAFEGRASVAALYKWIAEAIAETAVESTMKRAPRHQRAVPVEAVVNAMADIGVKVITNMANVEDPGSRSQVAQFILAVPFLDDIWTCLRVGRTMLAMADMEDGKSIGNVRLAAAGTEVLGRALDRAARHGLGREANITFLQQVMAAIREEAPNVSDRIIAKINERASRAGDISISG